MKFRVTIRRRDIDLSGVEESALLGIAESVRGGLADRTPSSKASGRWAITGPDDHSVEVHNDVPYLVYLERGTGLYGPHQQRIRPTEKTYLSWMSGGTRIFARSVKGMRAQPFVRKGIQAGVSAWRRRPT